MQLVDIICYVIITISVTTCAQAEMSNQNTIEKKEKVLRKRDTTLLSSNFEAEPLYYTPNIIYKKMSRSTYRKQKPKHTSRRLKPSYGQLAYSQKHGAYKQHKNYKNSHFITQKPLYNEKHKHYGSKHKHLVPKRIAPMKPTTKKPSYRLLPYKTNFEPKHREIKEHKLRDIGGPKLRDFGEPQLIDFGETKYRNFGEPKLRDYGEPKLRNFGEPKAIDYVDSKLKDYGEATRIRDYGENKNNDYVDIKINEFGEPPLREQSTAAESYVDMYKPKPTYLENIDSVVEGTTNIKSLADPSLFDESDFSPWNSHKYESNSHKRFTFHKKHPVFLKDDENFNNVENNRYGRDSYKRGPHMKLNKFVNTAWKSHDDGNKEEDIVGGQYAEPPARYVPKFMPSAPMFRGEDEFEPPMSFDDDDAPSATVVSAYVNYKNSNMAFSPQNLNDAFSVDK